MKKQQLQSVPKANFQKIIDKQQEEIKKKVSAFKTEYFALTEKYGLDYLAILDLTPQGAFPKLVIIDKQQQQKAPIA